MKKIVMVICVISLLLISALAGDIPEALMDEDGAQIFFGEVVSYESGGEIPYVEVIPTEKIKGDVIVGICGTWQMANTMGDFAPKPGEIYLFTYLNESNSTDIFEVTSFDTSNLEVKNVSGDMWERFEKYLNEGRYLDAEHERIERQNKKLPKAGEDIALSELIGVAKEAAKEVKIHYNGESFDIDSDKFYDAIDGIILKDIEDTSLLKENGEIEAFPNGMYITVNGLDGFAFITDDCKVDKYSMSLSRLPVGAYTIEVIDRAKIMALLLSDFELPVLESVLAKRMLYGFLFVSVIAVIAVCLRKPGRKNEEKDINV